MEFKLNRTLQEYKDLLTYEVSPYNSFQEKTALIKQSDGEKNPIRIAKILGLNPSNRFEAIAMIFKARENSVDDLIEFNYKCKECGFLDLKSISISDMFFKDDIDESLPIGIFETLDEIISEEDINNLSIKEFNELEKKLFKNNLAIFDPSIVLTCSKCKNREKTVFDISSVVSKTTLKNIYEQYLDLTYFSNITKYDVDNMYPFEREVFLGLIQKKEDEKAQAQAQQR